MAISSRYIPTIPIVAALIALISLLTWSDANAEPREQYRVYPGVEGRDGEELIDYGLHFDEIDMRFGARDFNFDDDELAPVSFTIRLREPQDRIAVRVNRIEMCAVAVEVGRLQGDGSFAPYAGETFHYVHINPALPHGFVHEFDSTSMRNQSLQVGQVAGWGDPCTFGGPHLHQSADLTSGVVVANSPDGHDDSCWTDAPDEESQCRGDFLAHVDWDEHGDLVTGRSGDIYDYIFQAWGETPWHPRRWVFSVSRDVAQPAVVTESVVESPAPLELNPLHVWRIIAGMDR